MNKSIYLFSLLLIIVGCLITGVSVYYYQNQKISDAERNVRDLESEIEDLESQLSSIEEAEENELYEAQETLISFFDLASSEEYKEAAELLEPGISNMSARSWDAMDQGKGTPKEKILEDYCIAVGTCLKTQVIGSEKISEGHYIFTVGFINSDGSEYVYGPHSGLTEEDMPSKTEFEFHVVKIADEYKVTTAPLYRP